MIKISRSEIYDDSIVFFFKGDTPQSLPGGYMFEESSACFSTENLVSNLIEYSDRSELIKYSESESFKLLLSKIENETGNRVTIIDFSLRKVEPDLEFILEYYEESLPKNTIASFHNFSSYLEIAAEIRRLTEVPTLFGSSVFKSRNFANVSFSRKFLAEGRKQLSAKYQEKFSAKYVDSQIPIFILASKISGTAVKQAGSIT